MKIAIPSEDDKGLESTVSMHFGHAQYYTFVDVEKDNYTAKVVKIPFAEHGPGDLPNFVKENGGDMVVAYGMGGRAIDFFNEMGIEVVTGVSGKIDTVIKQIIKGEVKRNPDWEEGGDFHRHEH